MPEQKISDQIAKVSEIILRYGWCKYELQDSQGRVCLLGAIGIAEGIDIAPTRATAEQVHLCQQSSVSVFLAQAAEQAIPAFNDHRQTTELDIMNFIHDAMIKAKEQGI